MKNKYILIWIGNKIKTLRQDKGWNLGEFAHHSKISISMLSKIENGRVYPTFPSLLQILKTLDVDLNAFFNDLDHSTEFPGYLIIRNEEARPIQKEDSTGFQYNLILSRAFESNSVEISVLSLSSHAERDLVSTEGYQYLYILNGNVNYILDGDQLHLKSGDSLFFDGKIPHVPRNPFEEEARLLAIYFLS